MIFSERKGVELQNRMRCEELEPKFGPMVRAILAAYQAECEAKSKPLYESKVTAR